jgi:uncharacterized phage-associated protein
MSTQKITFLIQGILHECGICDRLKVNKLCYFIDFEHYLLYKESISGKDYYHLPRGPIVDGYKRLFEEGSAQGLWTLDGINLIPLTTHDASDAFSVPEQLVINTILSKYQHLTGLELQSISHEDPPWTLTTANEKIDYDLVFWRETEEMSVDNITSHVISAA